ncbi:unnamed protein product, partial [Urochloa humidicola]
THSSLSSSPSPLLLAGAAASPPGRPLYLPLFSPLPPLLPALPRHLPCLGPAWAHGGAQPSGAGLGALWQRRRPPRGLTSAHACARWCAASSTRFGSTTSSQASGEGRDGTSRGCSMLQSGSTATSSSPSKAPSFPGPHRRPPYRSVPQPPWLPHHRQELQMDPCRLLAEDWHGNWTPNTLDPSFKSGIGTGLSD